MRGVFSEKRTDYKLGPFVYSYFIDLLSGYFLCNFLCISILNMKIDFMIMI